jgi:hypothetical protein
MALKRPLIVFLLIINIAIKIFSLFLLLTMVPDLGIASTQMVNRYVSYDLLTIIGLIAVLALVIYFEEIEETPVLPYLMIFGLIFSALYFLWYTYAVISSVLSLAGIEALLNPETYR